MDQKSIKKKSKNRNMKILNKHNNISIIAEKSLIAEP